MARRARNRRFGASATYPRQVGARWKDAAAGLLKRASFSSRDELRQRMLAFIDYFNHCMAKPFRWTYRGKLLAA
jgi:hypothetical protein